MQQISCRWVGQSGLATIRSIRFLHSILRVRFDRFDFCNLQHAKSSFDPLIAQGSRGGALADWLSQRGSRGLPLAVGLSRQGSRGSLMGSRRGDLVDKLSQK